MKKSNIYTSTGDQGTTSIVGGKRLDKDHPRIEAYGSVDELNAAVAVVASAPPLTSDRRQLLTYIQQKLFNIGAYLATDYGDTPTPCPGLDQSATKRIEQAIDTIDSLLPPLHAFVLPSGTTLAALAHVARTTARRAERRIVSLARDIYIDPEVLRFINRLSDLLFVIAREANFNTQTEEIIWDKNC